MPVGAPRSTVDPQFCQFERVVVGLSLGIECASAPAEDGNPFLFLPVGNHDGRSRHPLTIANFFRIELDGVATVISGSHQKM
jgi:hypothetical protein